MEKKAGLFILSKFFFSPLLFWYSLKGEIRPKRIRFLLRSHIFFFFYSLAFFFFCD